MKKARTVKIYKSFIIVIVFLFALIIGKLCYVVLSPKVDGIDLTAFASNRNTVKEKIVADRGTIYDAFGNTLAVNVNSYTVIAYLDESRTTDPERPQHVVDKEATAKALSPIINMSEEDILYLLNSEGLYQVELGPGGRGITELVKESIEALNLPGIDFIKSVKRYYPNRDFLSYTLGYAKTMEDGSIVGEMGLELEYNDELTGKDGSRTYEGDIYGYKIANTNEVVEPAENGKDIYLTIDTNIQMFVEQAMSNLETSPTLEWATISIVDAKTGAILGVSSNPSFDPNIKDIVSYYDPFVSYTYEPGSTMKTFSFMSAIEHGLYNPEETYMSGEIYVGEDKIRIQDWNKYGWGEITFDQGYIGSSNVAATILSQKQGGAMLKDFYKQLGYGKKSGITLPNEEAGTLPFKYEVEVANASFGQGLTVTPVQMVQAFTSIANEGIILKPYIVEKIVDSNTGEIILQNGRTEIRKVASKETINKMKELLYGAVNSDEVMVASSAYKTDIVTTMGKTGTAQIASPYGGYLTGYNDYVRSFAGLFPYEDPQFIVYAAASRLNNVNLLSEAVKALIEDVSTYKGVIDESYKVAANSSITSLINKNVNDAKQELEKHNVKVITIGNGDKVITQYPTKGTVLNANDKVFLVTNSSYYTYANVEGWSRKDLEIYASLLNVNFSFIGYGYANGTNLNGRTVNKDEIIEINLKPIYNKTEKETENSTNNS